MKSIRLIFVVTAATAILAMPATAKGGFNIVTVAGPDWYGEIEITDPDLLPSLGMNHFLNLDRPIDAPVQVGRGYLINRGYVEGPERHMFDRIVYFPGSPSHAYYLEIVNGAGPMDGNWYTISEQGEQALAVGLNKQGVGLAKPVLSLPIQQPVGGAAANTGEPAGVAAIKPPVERAVANTGEPAGVAAIKPPVERAVANTGEPAGVTIADAMEPDIDLMKAVKSPPFNVGGPVAVGLLLGAVLLGSVAGWALKGMRLERIPSARH